MIMEFYGYYSFLFFPLLDWFKEKWDFYFEVIEGGYEKIDPQFYEELGLTEEEFIKKFIKPYQNYTLEQKIKIAAIQTSLSKKLFDGVRIFSIRPLTHSYSNALDWVLVNIKDLGLMGLEFAYDCQSDTVMEDFYKESYKQCIYCGQPNKDPRGNNFGYKDLSLCHTENCDTTISNVGSYHDQENCCFLKWKRIKKNLRSKLNRARNNNKYSEEAKQEKIIKIFIDFCDKQFIANQKIKYSVQTINESYQEVIPFDNDETNKIQQFKPLYDVKIIGTIDNNGISN